MVRPARPSRRALGAGMVVASSMGFATLPLFGKLAFSSGVDPFALLAWRFGLAAVLLAVIASIRSRRAGAPLLPPRGLTLRLLVTGMLLLTGEVVLYFTGLQRVSAGLAETLLFLYPAWVVLIAAVFLRQRPTAVMVGCVLAAVAGAALTVGGAGMAEPLGVTLVVGASVGYAGYVVVASRLVPRAGSLRGTAVVMTGAAVSFLLLTLATGSVGPHSVGGWVGVAGLTLLGTVVAFGLLSSGLALIAPAQAAVISTIEPVITVVLGALLLGESVVVLQVVGMAVILLSVAVLLVSESRVAGPVLDPGTILRD